MEKLDVDIGIIGGGLAGLNASIAIGEREGEVALLDKGNPVRSGSTAGGVDHFMAYLNKEGEWDTEKAYLEYVKKVAYGIVNLKIHKKVFCDELEEAIRRLENVGVPLTFDGKFIRTRSFGQPGPYMINFNGKDINKKLARYAKSQGVQLLKRMIPVKIFKLSRGFGLLAFNYRNEEFYCLRSKALIIASGNANRLFESPHSNPFNTWQSPYNTGDGHVLAFNAGAKLANMEFARMTIVPKGFSAPGLNAFMGLGARLVNSKGEPFMERYHPDGEKAPRSILVYACLTEIIRGNGPLYLDCRGIDEEKLEHLLQTLGLDKETLPDFLRQKGVRISEELLEITVSEGGLSGPVEIVGAGIKIDENCMSSVPGLFAAGDCSDQMKCVHMAVAGGYAAGKNALEYAKNTEIDGDVKKEEIEREIERFLRPLEIEDGITYMEFEDVLRKIMSEHVGPFRTEKGLKAGIEKLNRLEEDKDRLMAEDNHELLRVTESRNLLTIGKIMAHAALFRKESRFVPYHYRLDHPETDNRNWCGQVVVYRDGDEIRCEFEEISY